MGTKVKNKDKDLAKELKKFMDSLPDDSDATMDDFYDKMGVKKKHRTGFGTAALLKQYYELVEEERVKNAERCAYVQVQ
jgi:hypothetical protein